MVESKACTKCGENKSFSCFGKSKDKGDGLNSHCKSCVSTRAAARYVERRSEYLARNTAYRLADPQREKLRHKKYVAENREKYNAYHRKWRNENAELSYSYSRKWFLANGYKTAESRKFYMAAWRKNNADKTCFYTNCYRAAKLRAMPPWLTSEMRGQMEEIYANCPDGYHVDHIHPLQGKTVCGLHVPWNLQYLAASENQKKSNKLSVLGI